MANWVKDYLEKNPDKVSKIHSRARGSITFKEGGYFVTECLGGPIHYFDGIWKPIDTKLLPIGVEYGAPGLNTRIKKDGLVRISGSTGKTLHTQSTNRIGIFNVSTKKFTSLLTFPIGVVSDDCVIREKGNYHHCLRLTETGLRESLTIDVAPSGGTDDWAVIETNFGTTQIWPDGWLGDFNKADHIFPIPYGIDAKNKPILMKRYARYVGGIQYLYTGVSIAELSKYTFPVVLDPDYLDMVVDGFIYGASTSYSTARSTSSTHDTTYISLMCGQYYNTGILVYDVYRAFTKFDTTAIPAAASISQVNKKMVCIADYSDTDFDVQIVKQDWSAQDPISASNREAAYDNCLAGTADDSIWRNTSGMAINTQYASGNLSTSWVVKAGYTYYSLRSSRDYNANQPTGLEYIHIASQENATESYRPILTVVWSVAYIISAAGGGYALTGQAVDTLKASKVLSEVGSYTFTGQDVALIKGIGIVVDAGEYILTGQDVATFFNRKIICDDGSYITIGQILNLIKDSKITLEAGSFNLSGQVVSLLKTYLLLVEVGEFKLIGKEVTFIGKGHLIGFSCPVPGSINDFTCSIPKSLTGLNINPEGRLKV